MTERAIRNRAVIALPGAAWRYPEAGARRPRRALPERHADRGNGRRVSPDAGRRE